MKSSNQQNLSSLFESIKEAILPNNSIDCVVFGYENQTVKILLSKWKGLDVFGLPGGFVFKEEDLDAAAKRVLKERTGIENQFLEQFHTFGSTARRSMEQIEEFAKQLDNVSEEMIQWQKNRFITTGYLSIVDANKCSILPDPLSESCCWYPVFNLPPLVFDHSAIVLKALDVLQSKIDTLPIGPILLPVKFTMGELQKLHEAILNKPLDRGNFQRKMRNSDLLTRHEKQKTGKAHKAPFLYSFQYNSKG